MDKSYKATIYVTDNYSKFKSMLGNRNVAEKRVKYIMTSIDAVGYVSNPIIVNEKMEVVDGQGRLEALKRLGKPVEYRVIPGVTVNECRMLNMENTSWDVSDHIKSHADLGEHEYQNLYRLKKAYGFSYSVMMSILYGKQHSREQTKKLRYNGLQLSGDEIVKLDEILKYLSRYKEIQKNIGGNGAIFYICMAFIYRQPDVDLKHLWANINERYRDIDPPTKEKHFLEDISKIYNLGLPKKKKRLFESEWLIRD